MAQTNFSECIRVLKSISFALNKLEVKGRENLDILLGSIQALDKTADELERGMKDLTATKDDIKLEIAPVDDNLNQ